MLIRTLLVCLLCSSVSMAADEGHKGSGSGGGNSSYQYLLEYVPTVAEALSWGCTGAGAIGGFGGTFYFANSQGYMVNPTPLDWTLVSGAAVTVGLGSSLVGALIGKKMGQTVYPYLSAWARNNWIVKAIGDAGQYTWDALKYGYAHVGFLEAHLRRRYLQGTPFALDLPNPVEGKDS